MNIIDLLEDEAYNLDKQDSSSLSAYKKIFEDVEDAIAQKKYANEDEYERLHELKSHLEQRIDELGGQKPNTNHTSPPPHRKPAHATQAEELMNQAETAFYASRYAEAIRLYEKVLAFEPDWERAKEHKNEAEKYLREGPPDVALPPAAAIAYGKAQSAVRVKNYKEARKQIEDAQKAVDEAGIPRWTTGLNFSQKLDDLEGAERTYQEATDLFRLGNLDEAIDKAETAYQASPEERYKEKGKEWRTLKLDLVNFNQVLSGGQPSPKVIAEKKSMLDHYLAQHGEIPVLIRARNLLENKLPSIEELMFEEARSKKTQAERATTIEDAISSAKQAQQFIRNLQELGSQDDRLPKMKTDIDRYLHKLESYDEDLSQASQALDSNPRWPAEAWHLSANIRRQFPRDPEVVELTRGLSFYGNVRNTINGTLIILGIILTGLLLWLGSSWLDTTIKALTPTPTPTTTATFTPSPTSTITPLPTATLTLVPTETSTPLPSPTSTPVAMYTIRSVFARQDCYEGFVAVDRIPEGSKVTLLPVDARRDDLGRTCFLVEYRSSTKLVTGWILLIDLQP